MTLTTSAVAALSPTTFEGVIDFSWNAKIHRHILDVLSPVGGVSSKFLHLKEEDETRGDGEEVEERIRDKTDVREE